MNTEETKQEKQQQEKKSSNLKAEVFSWIKIIVSAAIIAFCLNTFIIANSRIPSGSMENTIMTNDRVIGSRLSYLFSEPERGDVMIFRYPDEPTGKIYYVKRVIGLPGETVEIKNGQIYINDSETPLDEPYLKETMNPEASVRYEVPENSYFMLGDNRNHSWDSRRWQNTFVEKKDIVAKVLFRYFPSVGLIK